MHRTAQALVNNEVPDHRGARQYYLRTGLLTHTPVPEADSANLRLAQRPTAAEDSIAE